MGHRRLTRSASVSKYFKKPSIGGLVVAIWIQYLVWTTSGTDSEFQHPNNFKQMSELQRSTARYQQYINPRHDSIQREPLQVEEQEDIFAEWRTLSQTNPYHLGATIKNWDEQRAEWLYRHSRTRATVDDKPRVLIITGSQPGACPSSEGDHFHVKALKNKIDYARIHGFEIFYNFCFLDQQFTGVWAKLPIVRTLMLRHPEIEWFMWMDADAIFTDMLFEIPLHEYVDYNLVIWAWVDGFYKKNWVAVNDGVFLLRNCQWSLDLFDKWSPMGPVGKTRNVAGEYLSSFLTSRRGEFPADDQSALTYVMLTDKDVMDKVKMIEREYKLHGYWVDIVHHFEEFMEKYHPRLGDCRWPLVTHFTGCSPCTGYNNPNYPLQMCMDNFNRAFNFADNQVLAYMGYQHKNLSSPELIRTWNETTRPLRYVSRNYNPWEKRMAQVAAGPKVDCF